jgi:hypothetical protein
VRISILAWRRAPRPSRLISRRSRQNPLQTERPIRFQRNSQIPVVRDDVPNESYRPVPLEGMCQVRLFRKRACERVRSTLTRSSCSLLLLCVVLIALPHTKMPHLLRKAPALGHEHASKVMNLCFCASPRLPYNVLAASTIFSRLAVHSARPSAFAVKRSVGDKLSP